MTVRFRQLPTFGRDTIRRFSKNIAERKQFGAREYEDVLQVRSELVPTAIHYISWSSVQLRLLRACSPATMTFEYSLSYIPWLHGTRSPSYACILIRPWIFSIAGPPLLGKTRVISPP